MAKGRASFSDPRGGGGGSKHWPVKGKTLPYGGDGALPPSRSEKCVGPGCDPAMGKGTKGK